MGRPAKYEQKVQPYLKDIKEMLERGLTEREVSKCLGIAYSTYNDYKVKYPELAELIKSVDRTPLIKDLENALVKKALGFTYTEKKKVGRKDNGGERIILIEEYERYQPPDTTAIFGALNRFDPNYVKDRAYYELKKQEQEWKKALAEANNFDFSDDKE